MAAWRVIVDGVPLPDVYEEYPMLLAGLKAAAHAFPDAGKIEAKKYDGEIPEEIPLTTETTIQLVRKVAYTYERTLSTSFVMAVVFAMGMFVGIVMGRVL